MSVIARSLHSLDLLKRNPAQPRIAQNYGKNVATAPVSFVSFYNTLGIVNRGVNMIIDAASQIDIIISEDPFPQGNMSPKQNIKKSTIKRLLNTDPNPFMDISSFRRLVYSDLLLEGNAFIYFDGAGLYHIPARGMEIIPDERDYVAGYRFSTQEFAVKEIIHIKENAAENIYRGTSRLRPILNNMRLLDRMIKFQDRFFENGAVPGLILKSPNALSEKVKEKMIESWVAAYSPTNGGRRPLILDGGLDVSNLSNTSFREMDFEISIKNQNVAILTGLGIPPILLEGGNNANIRPNQRLFYIETIIPLVDKVLKAYERYFSIKLVPDNDIPGLQPELQEQATFFNTLVNGGIINVNEAREGLAYEKIEGQDELRVPVNITGSAVDPSQGGRPAEGKDE